MSNAQSGCYTYFMIKGDFNPDIISQMLDLSPEQTWKIGDKRKNGTIYDFSFWQFGTCDEYDVYVENQMLKTIEPLLSKINILKEIKQRYDVDFTLEIVPTIMGFELQPLYFISCSDMLKMAINWQFTDSYKHSILILSPIFL